MVPDRVLKHRPDLPLDVLLGDLQSVAEQIQTQVSKVVELPEKESETSGSSFGVARIRVGGLARR